MIRRLGPLRLLLAVVLIIDAAAVGAHEIAVHSQPCVWGPWPVPHCQVLR